jgi:hypothetical protein
MRVGVQCCSAGASFRSPPPPPAGCRSLAIQQLVAQAGIERSHVSILPWAAWRDGGRPGTHSCDPALHRLGHELGAVVGPDVRGLAAQRPASPHPAAGR